MNTDLLEACERVSSWTAAKVAAATGRLDVQDMRAYTGRNG
jgi:hypothetical protein